MKYLLLLLLTLLVPNAGYAAACFSPVERTAEQLVRLHSQMMVITLSCRTTADGTPLPPAYQRFTKTNLEKIKESEQRLMSWHKRNGGGGEAKLDRMRTEFHNEYSIKLARMSPIGFCKAYRDELPKLAALTGSALDKHLQSMEIGFKGRVPACAPEKDKPAKPNKQKAK